MQLKEKIEKLILDSTQYRRMGISEEKLITSSILAGNEPLQAYLAYKHGVQEKESIGQDTIGSLIHLGFEKVFDKTEYDIEFAVERYDLFGSGWGLSGSIDIFKKDKTEVIDIKVSKRNTFAKIDENHQYTWQLNIYRFLCEQAFDKSPKMYLLAIMKDGGWDYRKKEWKESFDIIEVPFIDNLQIKERFLNFAKSLDKSLECGIAPPQCKELWFTKDKNGNSFPTRCEFYCGFKEVCPYYKPNPLKKVMRW